MRKKYLTFTLCLAAAMFQSCDDGRIYEEKMTHTEEGRVIRLTGELTGLDTWGSTYSVVVAGYNDDSDYAVITKALPANHPDGQELQLVMGGIGDEVKTLKLCAINRLRKSIVDFMVLDEDYLSSTSDTIRMEVGKMDVGMFSAIQKHIFNAKCISCHGQSTFAGAQLYLTEGESYEALVNKSSKRNDDMLLVKPGDAENSFLHKVLRNNGIIGHDHVDLFSEKEEDQLNLIDNWIDNGAQQ